MCTIMPCIDCATTGGGKLAEICCSQSEAVLLKEGFYICYLWGQQETQCPVRTAQVTAVDLLP